MTSAQFREDGLPRAATRPAPHQVWERCEFYILGFDVARLLYAEDGRPLGERYAAERVRAGVPFDMRRCPYRGSRAGREMNVSALRQVQRDWADVLDGVAEVRAAFDRRHGTPTLDWCWIWVLGRALTTAPTLYARRSPLQSRTVVPRRLASLYKPALGIAMTPEHVALTAGDTRAVPSADDFFRATEEHGVFLTPDAACAGPERQVRQFLEACLGPSAVPGRRQLAELLDLDDLIAYSWADVQLEFAKYRLLLTVAGRGGRSWAQAAGGEPPTEFEGRDLDELAIGLDDTMAHLGVDARATALGRQRASTLAHWCALFDDLLQPVLDLVGQPPGRRPLGEPDVQLMVRHLVRSWRSGVDAGIELATGCR